MMLERVRKFFRNDVGEIAAELAAEIRIVGHVRFEQPVIERELGVGHQHGKLGPRERLRAMAAFRDLHVVGQKFHSAVELAGRFQGLDQTLLEAEIFEPAPFRERERERLQIIVTQHQCRHVLRHVGQQRIARGAGEPPVAPG